MCGWPWPVTFCRLGWVRVCEVFSVGDRVLAKTDLYGDLPGTIKKVRKNGTYGQCFCVSGITKLPYEKLYQFLENICKNLKSQK